MWWISGWKRKVAIGQISTTSFETHDLHLKYPSLVSRYVSRWLQPRKEDVDRIDLAFEIYAVARATVRLNREAFFSTS